MITGSKDLLRERRVVSQLEGGETVTIYEAIMIMLTFGMLLVGLIGLVVLIVQIVIK